MPEEIEPESLSSGTIATADTDALIEKAEALRDRTVWDVNGERVGKIEKSFAEEGRFAFAQATLDEELRQRHHVDQDVGRIDQDLIASVDDEGVHLRVAADQFLTGHPEASERQSSGSSTFPRKTR